MINAMKFGQKLIVDLDYDQYMKPREISSCAEQLTYLFASNRVHSDPFHLREYATIYFPRFY
jgi:hypothetical protein